jgi:APA family basic amino acid/polyamine antiporter
VRPTVLAAGSMIGAGAYLVLAQAAAHQAGPGVVVSILAAAALCALVALCRAELASHVPVSGTLYAHAYPTLGELPAWLCAWLLVFAAVMGVAAVAQAWSGPWQGLLEGLNLGTPGLWSSAPFASDGLELTATGAVMDMPAAFVVGLAALLLVSGVSQGGLLYTIVVTLKLMVLLVAVAAGAVLVDPELWRPLVAEGPAFPRGQPGRFGWAGVTTGTALAVFAFLGFDRVWAAPRAPASSTRARTVAVFAAIGACALLFILTALVLTGAAGSEALDVRSPLTLVVGASPGGRWLVQPLNLLLVIALGSTVLGLLHANARLLQATSRDRLLPRALDRVHPHTGALTVGVAAPALFAGFAAALLPLWTLVALASGASLLAFAILCGGVVWLRLGRRALATGFRMPVWWLVAPLGLLGCLYLVYSLGRSTMAWLGVWLVFGLIVYFVYGYWRSPHHQRRPDPDDDEVTSPPPPG